MTTLSFQKMTVNKYLAIVSTFLISIGDFTFFLLSFFLWRKPAERPGPEEEIFQFTFGGSPFDLVLMSLFR